MAGEFKWPDNVYVLEPGAADAQAVIDKVYKLNGGMQVQFSDQRYALLFKPGEHKVNVNVGYYTSVMGLGVSPYETRITSLTCSNGSADHRVGALNNVWRSAENVSVSNDVTWAVSQAAPMRRCVVKNLHLYQGYPSGGPTGYASGGFLADCIVNGKLETGTQRQWLTRNSLITACGDAQWNNVYVGDSGAVPATHTGDASSPANPKQTTTVTSTPLIAEKPYVAYLHDQGYVLCVPHVETNKTGPTAEYADKCTKIAFEQVYVATPRDTAALINSKLDAGQHVILTPGLYELEAPLVISHPDTVLLGMGFPTLIAPVGGACVRISNVQGVRMAGILLQAGVYEAGSPMSQVLLQWGDPRNKSGTSASNPGVMSDVFARVGGANNPTEQQTACDTMMRIWSSHVVIDNTWLWRADHGVGGLVRNGANPCNHAIVVDGDSVIAYGLAAEHTLKDACVWNGNDGQVYFFQCEFPYDVSSPYPYVGYRVSDTVSSHLAYGVGVYSFFRDYPVVCNTAIKTPTAVGVQFYNAFTRFLDGQGGIAHVINDLGRLVKSGDEMSYVANLQNGLLTNFVTFVKAQQPSYADPTSKSILSNLKVGTLRSQ